MCTENQKTFIGKLLTWKGQNITMAEVEQMTPDEASGLIDKLKAMKSVRESSKESKAEQQPKGSNGQRFGMCFKLCVEHYWKDRWDIYSLQFDEQFLKLYDLSLKLEKKVCSL